MVTAVCSVPVLLRTGLIRVFEVDNIINENREPLNAGVAISFLVVREVDLAQSLLEASFQLGVGRSVEAVHVRMVAVAAIDVPLQELAAVQSIPILRGKKRQGSLSRRMGERRTAAANASTAASL